MRSSPLIRRAAPARVAVRLALVVALLLQLPGCASGRGGATPTDSRRSDVIYRDEIGRSSAQNAYDAVRLLRPAFLTGRGPTTILRPKEGSQAPVVYLDNQRFGDVSTLRNIPVDGIVEIRLLGATQAQMRWGMDHPAGVILVLTGTPRPPRS